MTRPGNQATLGNGCVCDSGCPRCDALAEAFEAMREALMLNIEAGARLQVGERNGGAMGDMSLATDKARAALALADKVTRT